MPTIDRQRLTFEEILRRIAERDRLSFTRWGDGEWKAAIGRWPKGKNVDGVPYSPQLTDRLRWAIDVLRTCPHHVFGLQRLGLRLFPTQIDALAPGVEWSEADVFHDASLAGRIPELIAALASRASEKVFFGPAHQEGVAEKCLARFIPVHASLSFPYDTQRFNETVSALPMGALVGLSTGMGANVWAAEAWLLRPDVDVVDFGSVWDPYVGVRSRRYMRNKAVEFNI